MDLRYYADVKDRSNNDVRLEIYISEYSGEAEEILLQADAITIEYCAETLFDALKPSLAHINILSQNLKTDLYSINYNDIVAKIYKNSELFWVGYVTPNIYNQPYAYNYDPITLECIDIVSNLGNMKYSSNTGIVSLLGIIGKCLELADPNHLITNIYVDRNIKLTSGGDTKLLDYAFIQERNFFDEKGEPENCDEVVGSILKCFGLTMVQYKNAFYIIEQATNLLNTYTLNKYVYNNGWSYSTTYNLTLPVRNSNTIGVAASNGQISLDNVYNKVTVIANNNPLDALLPDFNDKEDLENQNINQQYYENQTYTINDETYVLLAAYFTSKNNWHNFPTYSMAQGSFTPAEVSEVHMSTLSDSNFVAGMLWNRAEQYIQSDGDPSSLSWKTYLTAMNWADSYYYPYLELRKKPTMIMDGGYLIVNLEYKLSTERFPHQAIKSKYDDFASHGYYNKVWVDDTSEIGAGSWPSYTIFPCLIKVGDYFYNGEEWILQSDYNDKVTWWNSIYSGMGQDLSGNTRTWYRTWNTTHNDWEYVTEATYNSFSGTKETGQCTYANAHYLLRYDSGSTYVYITDEFFWEKNHGNQCLLIRKNVAGESIMDTTYKLTNTVSYKMNIIDATDGVAIKIDKPLYGEMQFVLYEPINNKYGGRILGTDPQWQSSKSNGTCRAVHISNLTLRYQKTTAYQDIFNMQDIDPDTIYTNVINDNYCKELEDVTLTVNTANDWANSYSYLIKQNNSSYDYIKSLYFGSISKRPEERLVEKYVNYYNRPRYQYGNTLFNKKPSSGTEIYPFQPITEVLNGVNKNFIVNSITYDISANTADINAFEV